MLISAKAYAYSSPRASASSESNAIAGVQKLPKVMLATTTSAASTAARPGQGKAADATADTSASTVIGPMRPTRSVIRPTSGFAVASRAAVQSQSAPIARAEKPSSSRRSGASTLSVPKKSAGRTTNQTPSRIRRLRSARRKTASGWGSTGGGAEVRNAQTASATVRSAAAPNARPCPTTEATPPSTGPNSAPTIAKASAVPIVWPRRAAGVSPTSQVRPPVQVNALPMPCTKRAASSTAIESAVAKTKVAAPVTSAPAIVTVRAPYRVVAIPLGTPPISTPIG